MSNRVVVITGGGSGMGRAAALEFAKLGDTVYILGRTRTKLDEVAALADNVYAIECDVTDIKSIESAKDEIVKQHGKIDVLVNNAGGNLKHKPDNPTAEESLAMWREVLAINLDSVFLVTSAFLPYINQNGRVIIVGSTSGITGSSQPGVTGLAYASAKAGLVGLMRTYVKSLGEQGITINLVAPGPVDNTNFFPEGRLPEKIVAAYQDKTPLSQFATVDNIAAAIIFLASEGASATTGEVLNISSGMTYSR